MHYEPIKRSIGKIFTNNPILRKLFYRLLDILLLRTWHIKRAIKTILPSLSNHTHILDAGCGFGQYCYYLSKLNKNWTIKGIDINEIEVNNCNNFFRKIKEYPRVSFQQADLTEFVEPNRFQFIISVDVMEHIENDIQVFQNFYTSLTENGMVLISTPSDLGGSDAHSSTDESFISEHVRNGYNIHEIETKLKNTGFTKVIARYQYGKFGQLSWKLCMKIPIISINQWKGFYLVLPIYYTLVMPICLLLNYIDIHTVQQQGTGLIVIAYK